MSRLKPILTGRWLTRPFAEDFGFPNQARRSLEAGIYFLLISFLFIPGKFSGESRLLPAGILAIAAALATLLGNLLFPRMLPGVYREEKWTVGKQLLHILIVLFGAGLLNHGLLLALGYAPGLFISQTLILILTGFFPLSLLVLLAERRRLKKHLEKARQTNVQLDRLHRQPPSTETPEVVSLTAESGRETLSLLPNQLIYIESVGSHLEIHWMNLFFPQTTPLRGTLREAEAALRDHPQFFRCHRAFIVNLRAVQLAEGNARGYQLAMTGSNRQIPVSRAYLEAFDERMAELM